MASIGQRCLVFRSRMVREYVPGDAHWLYMWTQVGDYVYVHDPSGKTPFPTPTPMGTPPQELFYPTETPAP